MHHEEFHFNFDRWALLLEGLSKFPYYDRYMNSVYHRRYPESLVVEEALANFRALGWERDSRTRSSLLSLISFMPPAYQVSGMDKPIYKFSELAGQLLDGTPCPQASRKLFVGHRMLPIKEHGLSLRAISEKKARIETHCPRHLITGLNPGVFAKKGAPVWEIKEIEMGFIKRYCDGKFLRETDHKYYEIDNGGRVKIPNPHRKELRFRELANILRKAGMNISEFKKARKETEIWQKGTPRTRP